MPVQFPVATPAPFLHAREAIIALSALVHQFHETSPIRWWQPGVVEPFGGNRRKRTL